MLSGVPEPLHTQMLPGQRLTPRYRVQGWPLLAPLEILPRGCFYSRATQIDFPTQIFLLGGVPHLLPFGTAKTKLCIFIPKTGALETSLYLPRSQAADPHLPLQPPVRFFLYYVIKSTPPTPSSLISLQKRLLAGFSASGLSLSPLLPAS